MADTASLSSRGADKGQAKESWILIVKRAIDFVGSLCGLVVLSPLFLVIYVLIKLDSPGPGLYRRRLIGYRRKSFVVYKFRSMVSNAHQILENDPRLLEEYESKLKITHDPRVTRIGRILRTTSADELPQLFNILRGDMSLVGPRMLGDVELARYGDAQDKVLIVKPGLTGLWQVSGRHTVSFGRRMELDLHYVDHWSLWLDLVIILRTPFAIIGGKGAM